MVEAGSNPCITEALRDYEVKALVEYEDGIKFQCEVGNKTADECLDLYAGLRKLENYLKQFKLCEQ